LIEGVNGQPLYDAFTRGHVIRPSCQSRLAEHAEHRHTGTPFPCEIDDDAMCFIRLLFSAREWSTIRSSPFDISTESRRIMGLNDLAVFLY